MRALFDTNVILDVLLDREPFVADAADLLSRAEQRTLAGFAAATTVTTIYYLCAKATSRQRAKNHLEALLSLLEVAPVHGGVLESALASRMLDFEDAVVAESAVAAAVDVIVSRNKKDFAHARLPVYTPSELRAMLDAGRGLAER